MLNLTEMLNNLVYIIIALVILLIINMAVVRELSVFFKLKDMSFLPAFDISATFIVFLFIWSILPNVTKVIWAIITFATVYYSFIKFYKLDWKEALKLYSVWLVFILLLGWGISALAGY